MTLAPRVIRFRCRGITALLTKVLQEQQKTIPELKKEIAELKKK